MEGGGGGNPVMELHHPGGYTMLPVAFWLHKP